MAVERLIAHGARRVAVLDIDSHHGNGTQGIFWTRDDVLFTSVHGDPAGLLPVVSSAMRTSWAAEPAPASTATSPWRTARGIWVGWPPSSPPCG